MSEGISKKEGTAISKSDEEHWRILAWALSIVGAVLALALSYKSRSVKYWAYLSISFFIVILFGWLAAYMVSLIPIVGGVLSIAIGIILAIIWIIGLVKCINNEEWRPILVYEIAKMVFGKELEELERS